MTGAADSRTSDSARPSRRAPDCVPSAAIARASCAETHARVRSAAVSGFCSANALPSDECDRQRRGDRRNPSARTVRGGRARRACADRAASALRRARAPIERHHALDLALAADADEALPAERRDARGTRSRSASPASPIAIAPARISACPQHQLRTLIILPSPPSLRPQQLASRGRPVAEPHPTVVPRICAASADE